MLTLMPIFLLYSRLCFANGCVYTCTDCDCTVVYYKANSTATCKHWSGNTAASLLSALVNISNFFLLTLHYYLIIWRHKTPVFLPSIKEASEELPKYIGEASLERLRKVGEILNVFNFVFLPSSAKPQLQLQLCWLAELALISINPAIEHSRV